MNCCLISGNLRSGYCGISDYVALLSSKLSSLGHDVTHFVFDEDYSLPNLSENLPATDIYSIQFTPYFYSRRGISLKRLIALGKLLKFKKVHLNFHEIWIGDYPCAPLKEKIVGWFQKRQILRLLKYIQPNLVTCSNSAAYYRLRQAGIDVKYLYLFGNIPCKSFDTKLDMNFLRIVMFGTLYSKFPYELLAKRLVSLSKSSKKPVELFLLGKQRETDGKIKVKNLCANHGFALAELGELPENKISQKLQSGDIGVCTTPFDIIGKSGTAAALLEHRLPVLAYDDGDTPSEDFLGMKDFEDQIFLINDSTVIDQLISFMKKERKPFFNGVNHTASEMINFLN